ADPGAAVNVDLSYTGTVATVSGLNDGDYTIVAVDTDTGCRTAAATVNVALDPTRPDFEAAAVGAGSVDNTVCDETITGAFNGVAKVDILSGVIGDYTVTWFDGSGTGTPGTYTVDAGDQTRYTELPGGTYTALIQNTGGNQCDTTIQVTIIDDEVDVTYTNSAAVDVTASPLTSCVGAADFPNGSISIDTTNIEGSGNYTFEVYYGGSVVDPDSLLDITGTTDIYAQKTIADPGAAVNVDLSYTGTVATVSGLNDGDYTIVAVDTDTGCRTNETTVTIINDPVTFTPSITVINNQTSCDLNDPNGELSADADGVGTVAGYTFEWFKGNSTNPADEVTLQYATATVFGTNNSQVSGLPAGTYTVEVTDGTSTCYYTAEATILSQKVNPVIDGAVVVDDSDQCEPGNGGLTITVNDGGSTNPQNGVGGYTFELFEGSSLIGTPLQTINQTTVSGGNDEATVSFTGLSDGDYTIRATDNNTSCLVVSTTTTVGFDGVTIDIVESAMANNALTTCFTADGELNIGTAIQNIPASYTDDITITWYVGTDTSDVNDQIVNQIVTPTYPANAVFSNTTINNLGGTPINIINGEVTLLPAISYTGVIELTNGCKYLITTDLAELGAPDLSLAINTQPTRCQTVFDGSFDITIDPPGTNDAGNFDYFVFQGSRSISGNTNAPNSPFTPAITDAAYAPVHTNGTFTSQENVAADAGTGFDFTASTITRNDGGSWVADGYTNSDQITVLNATNAANNGTYTITNVTATVITVSGTPLTADAGDNSSTFGLNMGEPVTLTISNLESGLYTIAIRINDGDECITNVQTITLDEPEEPSVTLNTYSDNTVCDISGGLTYNGFITVDATHPTLADAADFVWYEDLDDNGTYVALQPGAGSGVGFNVVNETENGVTSNTVSGLGEGKYRVVIENNAGACTDTLDIELFDDPIAYSVGNTAADTTHVNIINCLEFGAFTLERIL
ncbi:MAG: hypothetical protein RLN82_05065, partial [Pseudomonadales bacterium]